MSLEEHIEESLENVNLTAIETLTEFIKEYNIWAKYCHNLVKSDRTKLEEILQNERKTLITLYEKYCTSKNRQFHRTGKGYIFYGGTYNSGYEIESWTEISKNKVEIQTKKIKNVSTSKKYLLIKQGKIWKIDSVASLEGNNKWTPDIL